MLRKYKGRVVFLGDQVKDQNDNVAFFQELSSSPATIAASRMGDMYGLFAGHTTQLSDATSAYTQAKLEGTKTWVSLPRERWPEAWKKRTWTSYPVCPLDYALYGHPDSGGYWEKHCDAHLTKVGWTKASGIWPSTYGH